jgi:hypothetical protein
LFLSCLTNKHIDKLAVEDEETGTIARDMELATSGGVGDTGITEATGKAGSNMGMLVGIIVGVLVLVCVIGALVSTIYRLEIHLNARLEMCISFKVLMIMS